MEKDENIILTDTERKFKNKLIELREKHGYSTYYVAKETGMNYSYYHKLENMNKNTCPKFETMEKLASFYKIELWELFKFN